MIVHTVNELGHPIVQGDRTWIALRLGIPTCSEFGRIMTEKKRDYSAAARAYIAELLAEKMTGEPFDVGSTDFMARGSALETKARQWYELVREVEVQQVAFITDDEHTEGGSPDGLVGSDGLVEIKCRNMRDHMLALLGEESVASPLQVQGLLRLTGRDWCDVVAYNPSLPSKVKRVYRDEEYIADLDRCLVRFKAEMAKVKAKLDAIGSTGIIEDEGLLALLAASVRQRFGSHPDALTADELVEFEAKLPLAIDAGIIDTKDAAEILADVRAGRWDDVRTMRAHIGRALELTVA